MDKNRTAKFLGWITGLSFVLAIVLMGVHIVNEPTNAFASALAIAVGINLFILLVSGTMLFHEMMYKDIR